jgi:hypothetical protein
MDAALVIGIVALVVAIVVPFMIHVLERPRLEIIPALYSPAEPLPWTFAVVQVRNKPLAAPLNRLLTRQAAQGCVVEIDYLKWGTRERKFPRIPGRWSSHNPPIEWLPNPLPLALPALTGTARQYTGPGFSGVYNPALDPLEHDVAVSETGEEVAVAILTTVSGLGAFAWSKESYRHPDWANPDRSLDHGTYRIEVRVRGSSVVKKEDFRLDWVSDDFKDFRLQKA